MRSATVVVPEAHPHEPLAGLCRDAPRQAGQLGNGLSACLARGRAEEAAAILLRVLRLRFGDVSERIAARVNASDLSALESCIDRIFAVERPEDLFDDGL